MKRNITKPSLTLLLAALLLFAACKPKPAAVEPAAAPAAETAAAAQSTVLTLTDMLGRTCVLPGPAKKIVVLTAADCEILYAIGAGDALVGRGEYCNYPEEALSLPAVASGSETNLEEIIALEPDAVVMDKMDQTEEQMQRLLDAGVPVIVTYPNNIQETYEAITLLGELTDRTEEAAALCSGMQAAFDTLSAKAPAEGGGKVYFEVSPLEYGLWTAGAGTFMDEIANMLHLTNLFADVDGWAEISEEQVLLRKPDFIVTSTMYFGEGLTPAEEILSRTGWQDVPAVRNNKVTNANSDAITRPGPRLVEAAEALYQFIYGE